MNLKLRLQNKTTLTALLLTICTFVYQVCGLFEIVPPLAEDTIVQLIGLIVNLLVGLGVVVDPTTKGIGDSQRALNYREPYDDEKH